MILYELKNLIKDLEKILIQDKRFREDYTFKHQVRTLYHKKPEVQNLYLPMIVNNTVEKECPVIKVQTGPPVSTVQTGLLGQTGPSGPSVSTVQTGLLGQTGPSGPFVQTICKPCPKCGEPPKYEEVDLADLEPLKREIRKSEGQSRETHKNIGDIIKLASQEGVNLKDPKVRKEFFNDFKNFLEHIGIKEEDLVKKLEDLSKIT